MAKRHICRGGGEGWGRNPMSQRVNGNVRGQTGARLHNLFTRQPTVKHLGVFRPRHTARSGCLRVFVCVLKQGSIHLTPVVL